MADGPRCKRRKQANPKRSSVTNFNNGPEASSDSDDEDKLHIVEEESQEEKSHKKNKPVLPHNGDCNGVKDDCGSEDGDDAEDGEEDMEEAADAEDGQKDALVQEMLQQEDTAVIYPEAPEENAAETGGADENGTPDSPQLHMCPYCSRGYKRNASLKEHIKYRHETSDDNYSCSHCSYTFTYRSQLERHMSHHRGGKDQTRTQAKPQRHSQSSGGSVTRKFKCNVCSKAFKYKHHLKEHLRIHSGEKPYECANCKKRFSHSGSYSSHITSKKCAAAHFPNGLHHPPLKPQQVASMSAKLAMAPARKDGKMDSKPLQEQIPLTQIKTEPIEEDIKPTIVPPVNGVNRSAVGTALSQGVAMVVPTVGLVSPIGINISGLQNVFGKVLATGTQGKQGFVVQQPQQQIISLPAFVDHDGTTKIIINYSLSPAAATTANTQPASLVVKNSPPVASAVPIIAAAPIPSRTEQSCVGEMQDVPTDLSISKVVKEEPDCVPISDDLGIVISKTESVAEMPKGNECLLCEECPEHLEAVHLLQHRKAANGEAVDSAALDPSFADLLSEAGVTLHEPSPAEDVLSVLKAALASNARPSDSELGSISESVSIPADVVRKWFAKMNRRADREKSERTEESPTEDEVKQEDRMEDATSKETQDSEWQDNPESPVNLKLQKCNNKKIIIIKTKLLEKSHLEKKSESQEKSDLQEESESHEKSDLPEESESQEKSESQENSELEKSNSQANLELHNYSKPSENSERQEIPESQSTSSDKELKVVVKTEPEDPDAPDSQAEPLDLSLPKSASPGTTESPEENMETQEKTTPPANVVVQQNVLQNLTRLETTPLNLACINKDQLEPRALYVTTPQSGNSNFVTATQIPTLVAIAGQGTVGCLSAINPTTKQRTILIPQLTYTYTPAAGSSKGVVLNGVKTEKKERLVSAQKSAPPAGSQLGNDPKKNKMDQGIYPCDICCKVFQKGSSLLRHKYEHTGRRPHECLVCKKAFKHKHHLIEHARLHTGIKPYQCDKCGKRFSHSGSYSQHMNHRYSYCKRNPFSSNASSASSASSPAAPEMSTTPNETTALPEQSNGASSPALEESGSRVTSERDSEEEEEEVEYEEEAMCVEDIRVVQVDDMEGVDRQDDGQYEEQDGGEQEDSGEEMEIELGEGSEDDSENENGTDFREGSRHTSVRAK